MCSLAHKKDELSPSSSASPLELYPNVHYLREEVQDINSLWWIRFALGSLSQKEKWQLQKESDAKRLALAGEMHRVWCTHPILSDGNSETQPVLTLHHHGIWWCVYISRSLPIYLITTLASWDLQSFSTWIWWCLPDNNGPGRLDGNWFLIEVNL